MAAESSALRRISLYWVRALATRSFEYCSASDTNADFVCVDGEQLDTPDGAGSRIGDEVVHDAGTVLRGEDLPDLVADQHREKALERRGPPGLVEGRAGERGYEILTEQVSKGIHIVGANSLDVGACDPFDAGVRHKRSFREQRRGVVLVPSAR